MASLRVATIFGWIGATTIASFGGTTSSSFFGALVIMLASFVVSSIKIRFESARSASADMPPSAFVSDCPSSELASSSSAFFFDMRIDSSFFISLVQPVMSVGAERFDASSLVDRSNSTLAGGLLLSDDSVSSDSSSSTGGLLSTDSTTADSLLLLPLTRGTRSIFFFRSGTPATLAPPSIAASIWAATWSMSSNAAIASTAAAAVIFKLMNPLRLCSSASARSTMRPRTSNALSRRLGLLWESVPAGGGVFHGCCMLDFCSTTPLFRFLAAESNEDGAEMRRESDPPY